MEKLAMSKSRDLWQLIEEGYLMIDSKEKLYILEGIT